MQIVNPKIRVRPFPEGKGFFFTEIGFLIFKVNPYFFTTKAT